MRGETDLRKWNAAREQLDHVTSLDNNVRVRGFARRLDRHASLDEVKHACNSLSPHHVPSQYRPGSHSRQPYRLASMHIRSTRLRLAHVCPKQWLRATIFRGGKFRGISGRESQMRTPRERERVLRERRRDRPSTTQLYISPNEILTTYMSCTYTTHIITIRGERKSF